MNADAPFCQSANGLDASHQIGDASTLVWLRMEELSAKRLSTSMSVSDSMQ